MRFNLQRYDFTTIPKKYLKNKTLSLKAKGLLTTMFALPDEWNYNIKGLCSLTNTGEKQIKNILNELQALGYLEIKKTRNEKGQFEYNYYIYHEPIETGIPNTY